MEEFFLRDVRGTHVKEAIFNVGFADVVLHDALKHTTLGVEDRQSRTQLFWEGEEIKFGTEATVVASFRFLKSFLVSDKVVFRGPGSSVDSLQLVISLVTAPVSGRRLGQRKSIADEFCRRQVGSTAEVFPCGGSITADIVVNGEFRTANLNGGILCSPALGTNQLKLEGLISKFFACFFFSDNTATESLAFLHNALHAFFNIAHELRSDGINIPEVIVEAISDEGANSQIDIGEDLLDCLRHNVSAGVTQDL